MTDDASLQLTPKASTPAFYETTTDTYDLKQHMDKTLAELKEDSRQNFDKIVSILQQESAKRTALEQRLHAQLLLQNESMIAMELKLMRLEAKVERREQPRNQQQQQNGNAPRRSSRTLRNASSNDVSNIAVISSGASLTSGVTATSLDDVEQDVSCDGSDSSKCHVRCDRYLTSLSWNSLIHNSYSKRHCSFCTTAPTQGSRLNFGTLESILNNPKFGEPSIHEESTRATRGDDGNSSLATSVTNSTLTSTVVTRGGESTHRSRLPEAVQYPRRDSRRSTDLYGPLETFREPRSRSQSPLTVQSSVVASEAEHTADAMNSILSNMAIAPCRMRRSTTADSHRSSMANRVVSFTADVFPANVLADGDGAGDSITMPDELDNLSEVADTFASSARMWREEYEARLDALQKKWSGD